MAKITQAHRTIAVTTPLGEDVLLLRAMEGREALGRLFEYELDLFSEQANIKFDDIVGQQVTVRLGLANGGARFFSGLVSRFRQRPQPGALAHYRATVVPWLWFLTRASDCRIFQDMTTPDIIKQVFRDRGFSDFDDALNGNYRTWEYCVQYRETDFDFVSRLMEQEGIYYFFTHEEGKHTLVLADSVSAHESSSGYEQVPYYPPNKQRRNKECVTHWQIQQEVQSGGYALNDFDFEVPKKSLETRARVTRNHTISDLDQYDYPGEYTQYSDGEALTKRRIEEIHAQFEVLSGQGDTRGLGVGHLFKLTQPPRDDQEREYLITSASYQLRSDALESSSGDNGTGHTGRLHNPDGFDAAPNDQDDEDTQVYAIQFTAIESLQPYRTPRTTPKPIVAGPQTAIVVGPSGEEIWTDKHGRVKVQFHWDRYGKMDENSSCWVRVSQNWAGKSWGSLFLPRIGQEVIVEFLEGDPDRPIITGRVYNGYTKPPYPLPGCKTMSTVKSNSTKGGGGFNEIRFEDKKDAEQVFIHAQKNLDTRVLNDQMWWVGNDRHAIVQANHMEQIKGDMHLSVTGDQNQKADGTLSIETGAEMQIKAGGNYGLQSASEIHVKSGSNLILEASSKITIKAGGSFVTVGADGVFLSGPAVNINAGGSAGSGAGSTPDAPQLPQEADNAQPGQTAQPPKPTSYGPAAMVLKQAAQNGTPFCEKCEAAKKAGSEGSS